MIDHFGDWGNEDECFLKFIDAEICQTILYQTNLFVTQNNRRVPAVTVNKFYVFLGINLLMG